MNVRLEFMSWALIAKCWFKYFIYHISYIWMAYGSSKLQIVRMIVWWEFMSWALKAKYWFKYFIHHISYIWMAYGSSKLQIVRMNVWWEFMSWGLKAKCWFKYFIHHIYYIWMELINLQIVRILWRHFKSFSIKAKFWGMGEENSSLEPWMRNVDSKTSPHILHLNGLWLFKVSNLQDKFMSEIQVLIHQRKMLIQVLYHTSYIWMGYKPSKFQIVRMLWR